MQVVLTESLQVISQLILELSFWLCMYRSVIITLYTRKQNKTKQTNKQANKQNKTKQNNTDYVKERNTGYFLTIFS